MIISDLNYLEVVSESAAVQGGWSETDTVDITFNTTNSFTLTIDAPCLPDGNFASAGAKASADGDYCGTLNSFTKADTLAVVTYGGASFSGSTSVAAINN
ncbi:MAG: hypothetical protein U7126_02490 [Microcoleus sp.]